MGVFPGQTVTPFGSDYDRLAISVGDETHIVERAFMVQIKAHLEQECERQDLIWVQRDQDYCNALGIPYIPTTIERVQPLNFFLGARPSLLQSGIEVWPSITARAASSRASSEQFDQLEISEVQCDIEVLCKAGPVSPERLHDRPGIDAEGEVNRQIQRLSAAVHSCIRLDPTCGGVFQPISKPPTKRQGFPFAVPGNNRERIGDYYIYCGKQMRYVVSVNLY